MPGSSSVIAGMHSSQEEPDKRKKEDEKAKLRLTGGAVFDVHRASFRCGLIRDRIPMWLDYVYSLGEVSIETLICPPLKHNLLR
jgi:hypothetical protein